jgi:hypothetical protein
MSKTNDYSKQWLVEFLASRLAARRNGANEVPRTELVSVELPLPVRRRFSRADQGRSIPGAHRAPVQLDDQIDA